jgi:hypothetical protein
MLRLTLLLLSSFLSTLRLLWNRLCNLICCSLEPPEIVPFSFGKPILNEGDRAQIICSVVRGDPPITITWSAAGRDVSADPALVTAQLGGTASFLSIEAVAYRHEGEFTCTARNAAGARSYTAALKVNGSYICLPALWRS